MASIGNYRIIRELGRGGMGAVYLAVHASQGYQVALKVLSAQLSRDPKALGRFHREARAIRALDHPNIVKVYETGSSGGQSYIAMQYIEGSSVGQLIGRQRFIDLRTAVDILAQVASALDYAHGRGFVHRDVKPSNILLTGDGRAILTDFGLAKSFYDGQLTSTGAMLGTPAYVSPEQARGVPLDHRSDIYSLGVVGYQMLTGRVPFEKPEAMATLLAHVAERPAPLRQLNPRLPPEVEQVVLTALAKDPAQRYRSAGQFAQALAAAAGRSFPGIQGRAAVTTRPSTTVPSNMLLWGAALAAVLFLLLIVASRPRADGNSQGATTPPPGSRRILFESDRDGNREIYVADERGSSLRRLTREIATDWAPAWSPDGQWIAFVSERDGNMEVYVMDAAGQRVTRLTDHSGWDSGPAWSPDGRTIAFDSNRDGDSEIYVMSSDGSDMRQLTVNRAMDGDPDWAPYGDRIAFVSDRDGNNEIYVMDGAGGNVTRLTNNSWSDAHPAWSPDGRTIAYECQRETGTEICTMGADGSDQLRCTSNKVEDRQPCWQSAGGRIAFSRQRAGGGQWEIWTMAGDGSDERMLIGGLGSNHNPAWLW